MVLNEEVSLTRMDIDRSNISREKLYDQRLEWALEVGEEFLRDLESEVVRRPAARQIQGSSRREAAVVGESQVGKTRLILRMQGIHDPAVLDEVEDILRGGSDQGNPATATATTYSVSPTNHFRIERPSDSEPKEISREEARARLEAVRNQMESDKLSEGFSLRIELPRTLVPKRRREDNLSIVDLPGLDGVSEREREYARSLATTHLHRAHLVMLVGRASEIPHLFDWIQAESDILPQAAWTHQKSRFAVVLTHSATAYSRQKQLTGKGGPDTEDEYVRLYEKDLRAEEETWDNFEAAGQGKSISRLKLYPVELGNPNGRLDKQTKRLVNQWTDSLVKGLVQRTEEASSEVADLRFLIENYRSAKMRVEQVLASLDEKIDKLKNEKKEIRPEFEEWKQRLEDTKERKKKMESRKSRLPSVSDLKREDVPNRMFKKNEYKKTFSTPSKLISYIRQEERRIISSVKELADNLQERRRKGDISSKNPACSREDLLDLAKSVLNDYTGRLKSKFSSKYLTFNQNKYRKDSEEKVHYAAKKLGSEIGNVLNKELGIRHSEFRNKLSKKRRKIVGQKEALERIEKEEGKLENRIDEIKKERQKRRERMKKDLQLWKGLEDKFEKAFQKEVRKVEDRMKKHTSDKEKALLSSYLEQLEKDYEAMMERDL